MQLTFIHDSPRYRWLRTTTPHSFRELHAHPMMAMECVHGMGFAPVELLVRRQLPSLDEASIVTTRYRNDRVVAPKYLAKLLVSFLPWRQ
eukprot:1414999-Amphidinium_carterae.1